MDMNVLAWVFALILAALTVLLLYDFSRGWRTAKAEKREEGKKKTAVSKLDTGKDAGIDLMGAPRPVFTAKLPPDGKTLKLKTPTKAISDRYEAVGEVIRHFEQEQQTLDDLEQLYLFAAMLLDNNIDGETVTVAAVRESLTPDDVIVFLAAYMEWLTGVIREKN